MDIAEIREEIKRLEAAETSYQNCTKLSVLYSIVDHASEPIAVRSFGTSEFLLAMSKANLQEALNVLDEHMNAIKILYPKEYTDIIRKIKEST